MKIKVEIDVEDFMNYFQEEDLEKKLAEEVNKEALHKIKRTKEYRDLLKQKENELLSKLLEHSKDE